MACIRKRRGHWCLDYRDQQGCRHWETTKGNRKEAELLAERVRQISRGTYQAPTERLSFDDLAQALSGGRQSQRSDFPGLPLQP